jgi:hypothetical protein
VSYDEFKVYEGQKYTGMKVGRSHKWYYDKGEWKEKKITPDLWQISYAVTKRRAGRAPEGSGVPVGTEYHWYGTDKWSASQKAQRRRMVKFLRDVIDDLEKQEELEQIEIAAKPSPKARAKKTPAKPRRLRSAA